jgi:pyruvate formate lyase activating enzyme
LPEGEPHVRTSRPPRSPSARDRRGSTAVVSGGEPTLQSDFLDFLPRCALDLRVNRTNGSRPDVLADLLGRRCVDYVAMDLKAPLRRYAEFAGVAVSLDAIEASVRRIRERAPDYEFRTTVAPGLDGDDLVAIAEWIRGARRYVLQRFVVPEEKRLLDPTWAERTALSAPELRDVWTRIARCPRRRVRA